MRLLLVMRLLFVVRDGKGCLGHDRCVGATIVKSEDTTVVLMNRDFTNSERIS